MKSRFLALTTLMLIAAASIAQAQVDQVMPIIGGGGGGQFYARCAAGDILNGFELRVADDVDAIRPICATPSAPNALSARHAFSQKFGGDGGSVKQLVCPDTAPAIARIFVHIEGEDTDIVDQIQLYCSLALPDRAPGQYPTVEFDGPEFVNDSAPPSQTFGHEYSGTMTCPQGLIPVGISGRSGIWLDAFGLICGASPTPLTTIPSIGRVNTGLPERQGPRPTLCEAARDARARNSPAAADLEAQCKAHPDVISSIGRVGTPDNTPRPQHSICDAAVDARARNSPAAVNLERQCQAAGGIYKMRPSDDDFEATRLLGVAITTKDISASTLRNTFAGPPRRGFEIGLGIWGTQTAPGPGKQRYHDFLTPAEQPGFDVAAGYAYPHNRYASLVAIGLSINSKDPAVRAQRAAVIDGNYQLGFDIASGLFGPKTSGAQGSKVLGTGSIAIRDSLNAMQQNGFNASMQYHISRNYP